MDFKHFAVGEDDDGRRLDKILKRFLDNVPLSQLYKLIRKSLIKVNDKKSRPDYRVISGDDISIASFLFLSEHEKTSDGKTPALNKNLQNHHKCEKYYNFQVSSQNDKITVQTDISKLIVFENEHILILNKPYDVIIHGEKYSLDKAVVEYWKNNIKDNSDNSLSFTPGPLHRIDRKTTGLIVFSTSLAGARWFSENIKNHTIGKKYHALVQGKVFENQEWCDFISKNEESKTKISGFHKVQASFSDGKEEGIKSENAKKAQTFIKPVCIGSFEKTFVTLAEITIGTGRKHQIRSQCSLHNHPLLGDTAYGGKKIKAKQDFYLQATELTFPENKLGIPSQIRISISNDFTDILSYCGIKKTNV
ncbi:RluA family pseudouridine synthase [Treponema sp. Marseille-Q3903]|uniref:RluA family pseudouridine synthase n=1 Tax=Treponema sp. Marseille-Q3903 TaxID=2766703 RepID=UPI001651C405|nr:RluA family pseudouridine synthase [Treponema sp. Marseille-Q3903]MBC6713513.1 RluA family pseudouridine synthase [Treponema sp. Marseille-Q3903]